MKRNSKSGFAVLAVIIAVLVVGFIALVIWAVNNKSNMAEKVVNVDADTILTASKDSGNMPDNVYYGVSKDGTPLTAETAKPELIIYEYADYQCPSCAVTFPFMSDLIDEYKGRVALVFRTFIMDYHQNGYPAAQAANAAALQGYWHDMALQLFSNQSTWEYEDQAARDAHFKEYFENVSGGMGDSTQFLRDMRSDNTKQKASFDHALAKKIGVNATPSIYINGESVDFDTVKEDEFKKIFRTAIDKALNK